MCGAVLVARAPTRLDFGGGWTDVPPYPEERGGFVCNVAIDRLATVTLRDDSEGPGDSSALVEAALRRAARDGVPAPGHVSLASDFPVGSGLGGSSAAGVALAAALAAHRGRGIEHDSHRGQIAEWSRAVEIEEMGIAGGRQDHYAAAYGGALALTFGAVTQVDRILLTAECTAALERRCLLAYTGESRISAATITAVLDAYRERDPVVLAALERMAELARSMRDGLAANDIDALAAAVDEHWRHQRSLHAGITTARIDALELAVRRAGALGLKALGASGGGCVIVFTPADDDGAVADAIAPFASIMPWRVAHHGVRVTRA